MLIVIFWPRMPPGGVDVRDGLIDAVLHLRAGGGAGAGDGAGEAKLHLRLGCARKTKARRKDKARQPELAHSNLHDYANPPFAMEGR